MVTNGDRAVTRRRAGIRQLSVASRKVQESSAQRGKPTCPVRDVDSSQRTVSTIRKEIDELT